MAPRETAKAPLQGGFLRSRDDDRAVAGIAGPKRYQVDCHWPGTGQIVELDGWEGHGTRSAFRDDRERDRRLRVAGYSVTRLTWN